MVWPLRLAFSGAIYQLTKRGNARQKGFFTAADRELFLNPLARVVRRYGWELTRVSSLRTGCSSSNLSSGTKSQHRAVKAALMKISRVKPI